MSSTSATARPCRSGKHSTTCLPMFSIYSATCALEAGQWSRPKNEDNNTRGFHDVSGVHSPSWDWEDRTLNKRSGRCGFVYFCSIAWGWTLSSFQVYVNPGRDYSVRQGMMKVSLHTFKLCGNRIVGKLGRSHRYQCRIRSRAVRSMNITYRPETTYIRRCLIVVRPMRMTSPLSERKIPFAEMTRTENLDPDSSDREHTNEHSKRRQR